MGLLNPWIIIILACILLKALLIADSVSAEIFSIPEEEWFRGTEVYSERFRIHRILEQAFGKLDDQAKRHYFAAWASMEFRKPFSRAFLDTFLVVKLSPNLEETFFLWVNDDYEKTKHKDKHTIKILGRTKSNAYLFVAIYPAIPGWLWGSSEKPWPDFLLDRKESRDYTGTRNDEGQPGNSESSGYIKLKSYNNHQVDLIERFFDFERDAANEEWWKAHQSISWCLAHLGEARVGRNAGNILREKIETIENIFGNFGFARMKPHILMRMNEIYSDASNYQRFKAHLNAFWNNGQDTIAFEELLDSWAKSYACSTYAELTPMLHYEGIYPSEISRAVRVEISVPIFRNRQTQCRATVTFNEADVVSCPLMYCLTAEADCMIEGPRYRITRPKGIMVFNHILTGEQYVCTFLPPFHCKKSRLQLPASFMEAEIACMALKLVELLPPIEVGRYSIWIDRSDQDSNPIEEKLIPLLYEHLQRFFRISPEITSGVDMILKKEYLQEQDSLRLSLTLDPVDNNMAGPTVTTNGKFSLAELFVSSSVVTPPESQVWRFEEQLPAEREERDSLSLILLEGLFLEEADSFSQNSEEMIYIEPGWFSMGATKMEDEDPIHIVYLNGFYLDKHEVTNQEYARFIRETGHSPPESIDDGHHWNKWLSGLPPVGYETHPVVGVSWHDAAAYCQWMSKRLPTEAEWEKSCRGGSAGFGYPWGEEFSLDRANLLESKENMTAPIGSYPSANGLLDMSGNVWEWVQDWYGKDFYRSSPAYNPGGPGNGIARVLRGGSWSSSSSLLRCAFRHSHLPDYRAGSVGFRCAR